MAVEGRGIARPFASIGFDGGQDKMLMVLQLHDLDNPDATMWKDGGRRRSIILARGTLREAVGKCLHSNFKIQFILSLMGPISGDYCAETRDNLEILIVKMKLRRALKRLQIPYQIMGDLKMMNTLTGFIDILMTYKKFMIFF